jgi:hypothetical protein
MDGAKCRRHGKESKMFRRLSWVWGLVALAAVPPALGADSAPQVARPLAYSPTEPDFFIRHGGQGKVTRLTDAKAVEALAGKDSVEKLIKGVDFARETIVLVSWTTAGPPEGMLQHETSKANGETRIVFFVKAPVGALIRGMRARIAADFFVVPKDAKISFDSRER